MGLVRALRMLIVVGVVSTAGAVVHAAPAMCDDGTELLVSLPPSFLRSPAPAEAAVAGPPAAATVLVAPEEPAREQCRPGVASAAGCKPYQPLPAPSRSAGPLAIEQFVLVRPPVVPPPASGRAALARDAAPRLAPGFSRRVDRPPRAS